MFKMLLRMKFKLRALNENELWFKYMNISRYVVVWGNFVFRTELNTTLCPKVSR